MADARPNAPDTTDTSGVSVVICAYTEARWDDLRRAVSSALRQSFAPLEVLVVIDHNDALLRRAQADIPDATVLENQEARGLSGARNTGVRAARGSLIAFLDDDAIADPDWLGVLVRSCEDSDVLGSGGLVEPAWSAGRPAWFPEEFNWVVGCSYLGLPDNPNERNIVRNLIGSSMLIRREVFDAVGGFRSDVGRVGKHPVGCEETELCLRALRRWPGRVFLHEPASRIQHVVPGERGQWRYFCTRCFYEGRSKAVVARLAGAHAGLSSERAYTFQSLPRGVARNVAHALTHRDVYGLARAGAIVAGLAITTAGYVTGTLNQALAQWERQPGVRTPDSSIDVEVAPSLLSQLPPGRG